MTQNPDESSQTPNSNSNVFHMEHINLDWLLEELERIDLLIKDKMGKAPKSHAGSDFLGLYVSEKEVNSLLTKQSGWQEKREQEDELSFTIGVEKKIANRGLPPPLETFKELYDLSSFEIDAVLLALASELDAKYEKIFAYMQDDVTKKRPTVGLILSIFCQSKKEEIQARDHFSYDSTLIKNLIFHLQDDDIPLLEKTVKLDDRVLGFLLGSNELDHLVSSFATLMHPKDGFESLIIPETLKRQLTKLASSHRNMKLLFLLQGSTELLEVAEAFCHQMHTSLLIADLEKTKPEAPPRVLRLLFREAKLQQTAVYIDKFDVASEETKRFVSQELDEFKGMAFVPSKTEFSLKRQTLTVAIPKPAYLQRLQKWRALLGDMEGLDSIASRFRFGSNKAKAAVEAAKSIAYLRNPEAPNLTLNDVYEGCRAQLNPVSFATKITPVNIWEDIVLPPDKKEQLREVCNYVKNYPTVYELWGFDKHTRSKGLNVLFSGPSGTGKTMAAEIIAGELGLDMYKIDLSMVVSKYIGETEKNLNQIFKDAEDANAVLFFDEADALFGKRSEIKDAHDRYANIEINYLLQKIEEQEGIVVLATNMQKNIDDAFLRRMNYIVEFPFPNDMYRLEIWQHIFPKDTPLDEMIDFKGLSKLEISGGNIKNIAVTAAFLAAEDSRSIKMEHLQKAAKREFQKIGKLFGERDSSKKT